MAEPNGYIQGTNGVPIEMVDSKARQELTKKLTRPATAQVGDYLRIKAIGADGTIEVEAVPAPSGGATVPTKVSAFENDAGYATEARVQELLAEFPTFQIEVVQELPAAGEEKTIYLVPFADDSGSYLEYLYVNGAWEVVGNGNDSGQNLDYSTATNKPSINGVELDGNKTAEELGIGQPTEEQISGAVSDWLDAHPEATSTVGVRSVGEEKIKYSTVHGLLLDYDLQSYLSNYDRLKLHTETAYGAYIQGQIAADGTVDTTKAGRVSEPFRCYPREVLHLSNQLTTKIAYYTAAMEFISTATMAAGVFEYTTPDNACWYRLQNQYSYGEIELITVRDKELKNRTFRDLILSPIKCRPTICFTGDSNTYGYGLSSVDKSWANLFISQLGTIGELTYGAFSKWVRCCGVIKYSSGYNCKSGAYMEFVTDAENVTLKIENNYSATWAWYVDGVTDSASDNMESIALDGGTHTVRVMFTGGQAADTKFVISKSITCINKAVSGVSTGNMVVERGCDWLIVMVGTNHRNENKNKLNMSLVEYTGKGSYVLPVPTHKVDESYTLSLFQSITTLTEMFEAFGFEIINCVPELSPVFSNTKYLQNDQIHFTEAGHIIICNTVSAKMGLPTYLTVTEAAST